MKIVLISPKGPLYRHRGGIFKQSLRYVPLTLTTLAALVPPELDAELTLDRRRHRGRRPRSRRRPGRADRDHRHGDARLRAGRPLPRARHHGRARRAARHADPRRRPAARRRDRRRLRRGDLAAAAARFRRRHAAAALRPGARASTSADRPFPRRDLLPRQRFLTNNVFEATRGCVHSCEFCVVPDGVGAQAVPEAGRGRRRRHPPARRAQADLRRPEPDRRPRLRGASCSRR